MQNTSPDRVEAADKFIHREYRHFHPAG